MSDYGIKTYADLAETCGNMVLANTQTQEERRDTNTLGR